MEETIKLLNLSIIYTESLYKKMSLTKMNTNVYVLLILKIVMK